MPRRIAESLMGAALLVVVIAFVGSEVRIGGVILHTQSSPNLEQPFGKFAFATDK